MSTNTAPTQRSSLWQQITGKPWLFYLITAEKHESVLRKGNQQQNIIKVIKGLMKDDRYC